MSIDGYHAIILNHSRAEHWSGEKYVIYFTSELPLKTSANTLREIQTFTRGIEKDLPFSARTRGLERGLGLGKSWVSGDFLSEGGGLYKTEKY